jgi:diguanylate cyclase (GGDEF)-like protein
VRKRWSGAWFFLFAALASMLGTALTEFSVWGFLPFNTFTYHGMELGMMLDATILALALAYFVRTQMSQRERAEREARLDPLTNLNNRRGFQEMAEAPFLVAVRHHRPLSLLMIDIDHFKTINDRYGHAVGDQVLIDVAGALSHAARRGDVLARWGGEEFILLLPETGSDEACQLAERLRRMFQDIVVKHEARQLQLTASLGVVSLDRQGSLMELVDVADKALYAAKAAGRNRVARAPVPENDRGRMSEARPVEGNATDA